MLGGTLSGNTRTALGIYTRARTFRMEALSTVSTFEHGGDVVYVHATRSVLDGWSVNATVVGRAGPATDRPSLVDVSELAGRLFPTPEEAVETGARVARAYLDRVGS